ncbi:hypothetical protein GCM10010252_78100 [Streptomyces aureoverticillatus]|nr:hypothetical protein GCM10010252_78100 [Streptomyces aureoverticillatus]
MRIAKGAIKLKDLGISQVKPRRAMTGGLILEIADPEGNAKAAALAAKLTEALQGKGIKVVKPTKMAAFRVTGMDISATPSEVVAAIALAGQCPQADVQVGEIRKVPRGMGTTWARCPAQAARAICHAGKLSIGWSEAKVLALEQRSLRCFKCLEVGHTGKLCTGEEDRASRCYRCGAEGHRAATCTEPQKCPLCTDRGHKGDHKLGGTQCLEQQNKSKKKTTAPKKNATKPPDSNMEIEEVVVVETTQASNEAAEGTSQ